jgi:CRISPR/Cas system CMR-associated protein Cmr5 small subunit
MIVEPANRFVMTPKLPFPSTATKNPSLVTGNGLTMTVTPKA